MADDLKPCPFCGGAADIRRTTSMWMAECANAGCWSNPDVLALLKSDVVNQWNRRAATSSPVADDGLPKPWQEQCDWSSSEPATKLMVEAMKAEIASWRAWAASRAQQPVPDAHPDPDPIEDLVDTLDLGAQPEQSESAAQEEQP